MFCVKTKKVADVFSSSTIHFALEHIWAPLYLLSHNIHNSFSSSLFRIISIYPWMRIFNTTTFNFRFLFQGLSSSYWNDIFLQNPWKIVSPYLSNYPRQIFKRYYLFFYTFNSPYIIIIFEKWCTCIKGPVTRTPLFYLRWKKILKPWDQIVCIPVSYE